MIEGARIESTAVYDVLDIAKQLYGMKPYIIPNQPTAAPGENSFRVDASVKRTNTGSAIYGSKDLIGREVFLPVAIEAGGVDYELPFCVLALRRAKHIVETPMVERDGSVKELIGLEDWRISLKGFLIDPLNEFPDDQLAMLDQIFEQKEPVRLKCALSDIFLKQDDHVVIKELDIPAMSKIIGVREFSISMVSDTILTLEV